MKPKARDALFDNLKGITEVVDDELKQMKNAGKVGLLHELIFILLCRVLDYKFIARDLLELLDQDVEMSFFLIERVLTVYFFLFSLYSLFSLFSFFLLFLIFQ